MKMNLKLVLKKYHHYRNGITTYTKKLRWIVVEDFIIMGREASVLVKTEITSWVLEGSTMWGERREERTTFWNTVLLPSSIGRLAQMAERSLSMREAPGSIPGLSSTALRVGGLYSSVGQSARLVSARSGVRTSLEAYFFILQFIGCFFSK